MEKEKKLICNIDSDLADKFEIALMLNKENSKEVISRLMIQYVSESFLNVSKSLTSKPIDSNSSYLSNKDSNYAKAKRKIPVWAHKPKQNNHRIIKAFFEIEDEKGFVTVDELANRSSNSTKYPDTFSTDFKGNFAQMKTDASNSHGKVFVVNDDVVEIWDEIKDVLMKNKQLFITSVNGGNSTSKITNEMVSISYKYAKKVYSREITRVEAKEEIARISGMNIGSHKIL